MTAAVDIANLSLGNIGIGDPITALTDASNEARQCNRWFEHCRQQVLEEMPLPFAMRAEALAEVSGETFPGWTYLYAYPSNALVVRAVGTTAGIRSVQSSAYVGFYTEDDIPQCFRYPFEIALKADGASRLILTDLPDAYSFHTYDVTNMNVWPASARDALAWKLSASIAGPLKVSVPIQVNALRMYEALKVRAATIALNQRRDDPEPDASSIRARG